MLGFFCGLGSTNVSWFSFLFFRCMHVLYSDFGFLSWMLSLYDWLTMMRNKLELGINGKAFTLKLDWYKGNKKIGDFYPTTSHFCVYQ